MLEYCKGLLAQSCLTLCDPMDCNPPGSSVHIILQASLLEWVAIPFSRGYSWPRVRNWVSHIAGSSLSLKPWGKPLEYYKAPLKISHFHPKKNGLFWLDLLKCSVWKLSLFFFLIKKIWPHHMASRILVRRPGVKPTPSSGYAQTTREGPGNSGMVLSRVTSLYGSGDGEDQTSGVRQSSGRE